MLRSGSVLLYFWCGGFVLQRDLPGARDTPFYVKGPVLVALFKVYVKWWLLGGFQVLVSIQDFLDVSFLVEYFLKIC